jgi:hypothetical protein
MSVSAGEQTVAASALPLIRQHLAILRRSNRGHGAA